MNKKIIFSLIFLNLFWAGAAFFYDLKTILHIPFYLWPFLVVCPVYPMLLAFVWHNILTKNKIDQFLLSFSAIASLTYFLAALIYYPVWMVVNNFDWLALGQIFWVGFYGLQGIYLLKKYRIGEQKMILVWFFLAVSFFIDLLTKTYGYLDFSNISDQLLAIGLILVLFLSLSISVYLNKNTPISSQI